MIKFIIGLIAIILMGLSAYMFMQSEKKTERIVAKKVEIKAKKSLDLIESKGSQIEKKAIDIKPKKYISTEENPESESENNSGEEISAWNISDEEMEKNEKKAIEKHRGNIRGDGIVYENDDLEGVVNKGSSEMDAEEISPQATTSISNESLLDMEEEHLSKRVREDKEPLEDESFNP